MNKSTTATDSNPLVGLTDLMPKAYHAISQNTSENAVSGSFYLSRPLYFEKLHATQSSYKINVFADVIQVTSLNPPVSKLTTTNKRKIHGFSDGSRHAMIEFLAKVEDTPDLFVTLTYSDDIAAKWNERLHSDFELFRKQLEYHYPTIRAMWRIEFVPRKSGYLKHKLIPHWHLLVWLPKDTPQARKDLILANTGQLWRNAWHKITHSTDENHLAQFGCKVERIKSRKHAYAYCSKYLAKETYENEVAGRRWGRIGKFEQPIEMTTELTSREYIHFKRLLNAYLKAEAHKRFKRQQIVIPFRPLPLSYYMQFHDSFVKMNIKTGCMVLGLGYISQDKPIGHRTYIRILRHARELAYQERYRSE